MSIADKLITIAENQQRVYDAGYAAGSSGGDDYREGYNNGYMEGYNQGVSDGYDQGHFEGSHEGRQAEYEHYWDVRQNNGQAANYEYAFHAYPGEVFNPKHDFVFDPSTNYSCNSTFRNSTITDMVKDCDFRLLGSASLGLHYTFYSSNKLVNARTLKLNREVKYNYPFLNCTALQEIRIEGEIGQNGFKLPGSYNLSHDSAMSIINALVDYSEDTSGTSWSIQLHANPKATLTEAEIAIATEKGWTIA